MSRESTSPSPPPTTPSPSELDVTQTYLGRRGVSSRGGRWARGDCLGRYVVLEEIGAGGMGIVYAAYDPELDRRIALKVLQTQGDGQGTEEARLRLLREAQALARVVHPNVVAIHDVGSVDEQVFLAMEFVEGSDLGTVTQELGDGEDDWRRVLRLFLQAGRGLVAAHRAGLAHRDFKPSNVRVGDDGRVRVLDFGLALGLDGATADDEGAEDSAGLAQDSSLLDRPLTEAGQVYGTPRYMAPEQHLGLRADARSDQFSFCLTLWEALYGARPFAAVEGRRWLRSIGRGVTEVPPSVPRQAARLQHLLARGLRYDPEQRFDDLEELLDALEATAFGRRGKWIPWLVAGGLVLAASGGWLWRVFLPPVCQGASTRLQEVWDDGRKAAISAAFKASGIETASSQWTAAERLFDDHAEAWQGAHKEVCEATHLRQEQSMELLDVRMACLDQRLEEFRSLTELFLQPTRDLVHDAGDAASQLGRLELCASQRLASIQRPAQNDLDLQEKIGQVRDRLAHAWALSSTGRLADALEELTPALEEIETLDYAPVVAEAALAHGDLLERMGSHRAALEAYRLAAARADEGRHDDVRARSALGMVWSWKGLNKAARASHWLPLARANIRRLDDTPDLLMRWHQAAAQVAAGKRDADLAIEHARQAVELSRDELGWGHLNTGIYLSTLGSALSLGGQHEQALSTVRHAKAILQEVLGERDARLSYLLHNEAIQESRLGFLEEARSHYIEAAEPGWEVPDRHRVRVLSDLASLEARLGRRDDALSRLQAALGLETALSGESSTGVARVLNYFGDALLELDDPGAAETHLVRALEILDAQGDLPPKQRVAVLLNLATARIRLERPVEAKALIRRARQSLEDDHPWMWHVELIRGMLALAEGDGPRAVELLTQVVEKETSDALERSRARFQLARAQAAVGNDDEALLQVDAASDILRQLGPSAQRRVAQLERWRTQHLERVTIGPATLEGETADP